MIKIFSPTDRDFTTNGDAIISPTRAVVHKEDNGDYYLELISTIDDIKYLKPNNIIVVPTPQGEQGFRLGAPIETTRTKIKFKAWHVSYDGNNYIIPDSYVVNKNCNDALAHLNGATDNPSPFSTYSNVNTIRSFRCVRKTLTEAIFTVLERWGGHIVRDNFNIQIRNTIGADNGVTIQYRKNLKNISVTEDWSGVCTKCLPVGKDGLTLDELFIYSETQYEIPYTRTVSFTQEINEEDYPSEGAYQDALKADLIAQTNKYLDVAQYPSITYSVSANIEKITDVGDIVTVYDERLGVDITTEVLSFEYDCLLEKYTNVTFGSASASLSNLMSNISSEIDTAIERNNQENALNIQVAIDTVTERVYNTLTSSYCIYEGDQILIVDTLPAESATNVIRISEDGLSFSNTGVNGTFINAWSIDGTLKAQAFDIVGFTADIIKGGVLKVGSNLNTYGKIEAYSSDNTKIAQIDKDGLLVFAKNGSYLKINDSDGIAGYDRSGSQIFYLDRDNIFHFKKTEISEEVTLCNRLKLIPITTQDNDGIGIVSVL